MKPRLIVVAGPNGSGKTTITEQLLRHTWMQGCAYINPDLIAHQQFGDWNDSIAVKQAADLASEQREQALIARTDSAFETFFSAPDKLDYLIRARAAGYFVRLFFVATESPTINAARVAKRMLSGGHEVPIKKIVDRYFRSLALAHAAVQCVDRMYLYDNSIDDADAKLVSRIRFDENEGVRHKSYVETLPNWVTQVTQSSSSQ